MIYFVQTGNSGPIKIGVASDIKKRFYQLQISTADTLNLLGIMDGDTEEEIKLHNQFRGDWIRGEWFRPGENLVSFIEQNTVKVKVDRPNGKPIKRAGAKSRRSFELYDYQWEWLEEQATKNNSVATMGPTIGQPSWRIFISEWIDKAIEADNPS